MTISQQSILERYAANTASHSTHLAAMQAKLMDSRRLDLERLASQISREMGGPVSQSVPTKSVLFDRDWLTEFALGDITRCLGKEFAIYAGRKSPRIPNGDLMLISRILEINGIRGEFNQPSGVTAEYDVSPDAWFFSGQNAASIPLSILMEIALQPCGVLSAWMHTQLRYPDTDFSFRNLDGSITLIEPAYLQGKTITTRAVLEKTSFSGSTIIQHFSFSLSCDGIEFLNGSTTFGYFPEQAMAAQTGLDNGKRTSPRGNLPDIQPNLLKTSNLTDKPQYGLPKNKLRMIDSVAFEKNQRSGQLEYVQSGRKNSPSDWYYTNHFLGDPVMPGSLGVETVVQAFTCGIQAVSGHPADVQLACGLEMKWKYRGQVLPSNSMVHVDIQITETKPTSSGTLYTGSANLWADDLRIYEFLGLTLIQQPKED